MSIMRKNPFKSISMKFVFLTLAGIILFSSCQSISVKSQNDPKASPTPFSKDMKKDMKLKSLADLKWEKRIILVKEKSDNGLRQLIDAVEGIDERHVVWFRLNDGKIKTNYKGELSKDFSEHLKTKYFEKFDENVFLIGKDGTIKSKDDKLNLKNYFGQIDSMPMRQSEMREKQN